MKIKTLFISCIISVLLGLCLTSCEPDLYAATVAYTYDYEIVYMGTYPRWHYVYPILHQPRKTIHRKHVTEEKRPKRQGGRVR